MEQRKKLKSIIQEVILEMVKSGSITGFKNEKTEELKKVTLSGTNTEMKADSSKKMTAAIKDSKDEPKRPVIKKLPKQEQTTIKESFFKMIKEEIESSELVSEMGRLAQTVGPDGVVRGVGAKFVVDDPKSKTGYSLMGHPKFPNGIPAEKPKEQYVTKGNTGMGRPTAEPTGDSSVISVKVNSKTIGEFDLNGKLPSGKPDLTPMSKRIERFIYADPDMAAYSINPSVIAAVEKLSDLEADGKLSASNNALSLKIVGDEITA
jgi:hypothetical protein